MKTFALQPGQAYQIVHPVAVFAMDRGFPNVTIPAEEKVLVDRLTDRQVRVYWAGGVYWAWAVPVSHGAWMEL